MSQLERLRARPSRMRWITVLAGLVVFLSFAPAVRADVDMTAGRLEKVSRLSSTLGGAQPLASSATGDYKCIDPYSVVANWYYYFAIGNCKAGWESKSSPTPLKTRVLTNIRTAGSSTTRSADAAGLTPAFRSKNGRRPKIVLAGKGRRENFKVSEASFWEKHNHGPAESEDGNYVANPKSCPEYANYRPWSASNVEKELIRTAPADAGAVPGSTLPALKWRYVTKYASTDGTGHYVMVRDDRIAGTEGNWVFVPRSCLPATLPENSNERLPPPPPPPPPAPISTEDRSSTWVARAESNGATNVYYVDRNTGGISQWYWTPSTGWGNVSIGGRAAAGTTPSAARDATTGNTSVYYVDANGAIDDYSYTEATGWVNAVLGGHVAAHSSPAAVRDPTTGDTNVYYVDSSGAIYQWSWTQATGWVNLGGWWSRCGRDEPERGARSKHR